jgi:type I restriction enzyme S subunit
MTNKVPNIRFKGFTDDWEQRKLSECAGFRRGSFPQPYGNKEWYDGEGGMPFVQVADVADDMKLVDDTKQKISKMAQPMSVYADKGSVLVTLQGSIGRVAITQYGAFVDRTVLIFDKYNQDIDKTFWAYIIKEKFIDEARKAPGGTIKTITKEALSDFDLMLPNYDEQKKISSFLMSLDNLITLHQRKCEQTKELKKFMLQKMFPKKGEKNPEIRFPGFTDAWEQRKFGELLNETRNKTTVEDEDTLLSCAIDGMFLNSELFSHFRGSSNIGYLKVKKNDLILSAQNLHLGNCNVNLRFEHGIISPAYKVYELIECDPLFMQAWVKQDKTKDFFLKASTEGASVCRKNIIWEELYKQKLPVPKITEQQKIGEYFSNLDRLITLHQRKCEQLKELKKFMLQNMFPKKG